METEPLHGSDFVPLFGGLDLITAISLVSKLNGASGEVRDIISPKILESCAQYIQMGDSKHG